LSSSHGGAGPISPALRKLCTYLSAAPRRALPPRVTERAKMHLLDTLAAMISGSRLLPGRKAIEFARAQGGRPEACVIGSRIVTSAVNAALANGMHGHADETDDTHYIARTHPGCAVVPAALAMAERVGAGGTALLRAMVAGYDLCARTTRALGLDKMRTAGFSTHSYGGAFGAAAAAGVIARLDADRFRHLLSFAAQQASGLSCWARDTRHVEKAFDFGGMPARNGVTAALMAAMDSGGVDDAIYGHRGLFHAHADRAVPERLTHALGHEFEIMKTSIKRWPVGYPIQAPLDAVSNIIARHGVRGDEVADVRVTIDPHGAYTVGGRKMSSINIQHLVALMLVDGEITFDSAHDEARASDRRVSRLKDCVELVASPALLKAKTTQAIVEVALRDGRRLRHHTRAVRGSADNPMSREEVADKCRGLLVPLIGRPHTERLIKAVWSIERTRSVRALRPLLRA
jgi:2-methylcitrate dehydratase PrpD